MNYKIVSLLYAKYMGGTLVSAGILFLDPMQIPNQDNEIQIISGPLDMTGSVWKYSKLLRLGKPEVHLRSLCKTVWKLNFWHLTLDSTRNTPWIQPEATSSHIWEGQWGPLVAGLELMGSQIHEFWTHGWGDISMDEETHPLSHVLSGQYQKPEKNNKNTGKQ